MSPLLACGPTGDAFAVLLMALNVWAGRGPRWAVAIGAGAAFLQLQTSRVIAAGHCAPDLLGVLIELGAILDVVLIAQLLMGWWPRRSWPLPAFLRERGVERL